MSIKCLMLETSEKKRLFTSIGSRGELKELCRTFSAKMQIVRANLKRSQLLTIPKIVVAICDCNGKFDKTEFEEIKQKNKSAGARSLNGRR